MNKIIAILGAVLVSAGCFLPVLLVPDRTFNFFDALPVPIPDVPENAMQYAGILIIIIATISITLAFLNKTKSLWISGLITGGILTALYFGFHFKLDEMKTRADEQMNGLFGGMFKGFTDSLFEAVELGGTGWYVIIAGALLLMAASFTPALKGDKEKIQEP
ncbi:MAG: hypothetical protein EPN85_04830 [Bacteroidetes bacterium]|nr:MAG: hypothetical protein EPN85_04830 [Bacteroidota bacterium]